MLIRISRIGPTQIMAMIDDVTQARRAEDAARERTAFAETIIASVGEGLIVYDRDLRYVVWNTVMEEMTGLPAARVIGRGVELFPEVMATGVGEDLQAALAGGSPTSREFEYVIPRTGRRGWAVQTNRPHRNAAGEIVGVVSTVLENTAEHEAPRQCGAPRSNSGPSSTTSATASQSTSPAATSSRSIRDL